MTIKTRNGVRIVTNQELGQVQQSLPQSLIEAAGLLKKKYADLKKHYQKIRQK